MSRELKALDSVTLVHPRDSEKQQADNQKHTRDNGEIRRPGVYLRMDAFMKGWMQSSPLDLMLLQSGSQLSLNIHVNFK